MKLDQQTFQKWQKWAEKIKGDLIKLMEYRQIHNEYFEMVNANFDHIKTNEGILFCDFVRECYGIQAAVGIRRHVKSGRDSISVMRLLGELKQSAQQFTYDFYLQQFPLDGVEWWQELTFRGFSEDMKALSEQKIEKDIQELEKLGESVSAFVNRGVAHLDRRGVKDALTFDDLDKCLDLFNVIGCRYIALLTAEGYITLDAAIPFNWQRIFTVPLDIRNAGHNLASP